MVYQKYDDRDAQRGFSNAYRLTDSKSALF